MPIVTRSISVSDPALDQEKETLSKSGASLQPKGRIKKGSKKNKMGDKGANKSDKEEDKGIWTRGEMTGLLNDVLKQNGLDNITVKLTSMQESLDSMQISLDSVHTKTDNTEKRVKSLELDKTQKDLDLDILKGELALERQARLRMECEMQRKNLILIGIPEEKDSESSILLGKKIKQTFSAKLDLSETMPDIFYRQGKKSKDANRRPRPIMMTFGSLRERQAVWYKKGSLRESKYFIKEDFPQEIEQKRRILGPIMREAKYQERRVKFINDRLWIDDVLYTTENLYILPDYLHPKKTSTKSIDGQIFYWGRESPFSNFYPSSFKVDDSNYKTVEEFFHAEKARYFGDESARDHIMSMNDPVKQKHVEVENYVDSTWMENAQDKMREGMFAKFSQSKDLEEILLKTGEKPLIEASPYDDIWGIGVGIRSKDLLKSGKWGRNWAGAELQRVRELLRDKPNSLDSPLNENENSENPQNVVEAGSGNSS